MAVLEQLYLAIFEDFFGFLTARNRVPQVSEIQFTLRGISWPVALGGTSLAAEGDGQLFLGEDFFPWLVLALGAAMVVGNALALVRPREGIRPSPARPITMIVIGLVAAVWGLASLLR